MLASIVVSTDLAGDVPLVGAAIAGLLYWRGARRRRRLAGRPPAAADRWRRWAFAGGLVTLVVALGPALDDHADQLFWAHMVQHMLLVVVAAPLIVLAAPWVELWRAFPLAVRRPVARGLARGSWAAPIRGGARALVLPAVAWTLLNGDLVLWHVPALYDLTLRAQAVHELEHLTFLAFGVLAWMKVIDSPPVRCRLAEPGRVAFALGSMVVGWLLGVALAFASTPWYSAYAALPSRPGGLSALTDQHLAGGIMWMPASIPWSILVVVLVFRWLGRDGLTPASRREAGGGSLAPATSTNTT